MWGGGMRAWLGQLGRPRWSAGGSPQGGLQSPIHPSCVPQGSLRLPIPVGPHIGCWVGAGHLPILEWSGQGTDPGVRAPAGPSGPPSPGEGRLRRVLLPTCPSHGKARGGWGSLGREDVWDTFGKERQEPRRVPSFLVSRTRTCPRMSDICVILLFLLFVFSVSKLKRNFENALITGTQGQGCPHPEACGSSLRTRAALAQG